MLLSWKHVLNPSCCCMLLNTCEVGTDDRRSAERTDAGRTDVNAKRDDAEPEIDQ